MTERVIASLMSDPVWHKAVQKMARRYSRLVEDRDEYEQDALLRVARKCEDSDTLDMLKEEARKAIQASYRAKKRRVDKTNRVIVNGCYERDKKKDLGHGRQLLIKPFLIDLWYFAPEWLEYGLRKDSIRPTEYQLIIVG
jgi:hypothetical protein